MRLDHAVVLVLGSALLASGLSCDRDGARDDPREPRSRGDGRVSGPGSSGSGPSGPAPSVPGAPGAGAHPPLAEASLRLTRVAALDAPLAMAVRAGDPALYVAEQAGTVRAIRDGAVDPAPVLDLAGSVRSGGEQGLLGIAFSRDGRSLYAHYTDRNGDTRVVEHAMRGGHADPASRRELLSVDQPYPNHNGGNLVVGPDGYLYIGLGDGGSSGDPRGNAQSLGTLLGKILRIDPRPSDGKPYSVPADNPFVGREGARPEIWAFGLRNPWRFSFDGATGDLWIGDVGQNRVEEIDLAPVGSKGGENYGWDRLEGRRAFEGRAPERHALPVFTYGHDGGRCSVTGGYVSRSPELPALAGAYVFGDHCEGKLRAIRVKGGTVTDQHVFDLPIPSVSSFGEDAAGTLYAMSLEGGVFRIDPA